MGKERSELNYSLFNQPKMVVELWSDGSSLGNPGPGGWCVILKFQGGGEQTLSGGEPYTTNNRMELRGVIEGLKFLEEGSIVTIYSDSTYVVNGINKWVVNWLKKGFKGVKNRDLWEEYLYLAKKMEQIKAVWVRGHSGDKLNERCDKIARAIALHFKTTS